MEAKTSHSSSISGSNNSNNSNNNNNINQIATPTIVNSNIININQTDDNSRKSIEYGKSMLLDITRMDEFINASDPVSELEIVMFSRRMTSRCSEISGTTSSSTANSKSNNNSSDNYNVVRSTIDTSSDLLDIIKSLVNIITNIIVTIKSYNSVARKGTALTTLAPVKNDFLGYRKDLIEKWNQLILLFGEIGWRIPTFLAPKVIHQQVNSPLPTSSSPASSTQSPATSSTSNSPSDLSPPASPSIGSAADSSSNSSSSSSGDVLSPTTSPSTPQIPTSPPRVRRISVSGSKPPPIAIGGQGSTSPPIQSAKQQQQEQSLSFYDLIHQVHISLLNLLWHLKNQQRINQNRSSSFSSPTSPLSSSPSISSLVNNNNISDEQLTSQSLPVSPSNNSTTPPHVIPPISNTTTSKSTTSVIPRGTMYIEQTKNTTLPNLCTKLIETSTLLNLIINEQLQLINLIQSLNGHHSTSELVDLVNQCINIFTHLTFSVKDTIIISPSKNNNNVTSSTTTTTNTTVIKSPKLFKSSSGKQEKTTTVKTILFNSLIGKPSKQTNITITRTESTSPTTANTTITTTQTNIIESDVSKTTTLETSTANNNSNNVSISESIKNEDNLLAAFSLSLQNDSQSSSIKEEQSKQLPYTTSPNIDIPVNNNNISKQTNNTSNQTDITVNYTDNSYNSTDTSFIESSSNLSLHHQSVVFSDDESPSSPSSSLLVNNNSNITTIPIIPTPVPVNNESNDERLPTPRQQQPQRLSATVSGTSTIKLLPSPSLENILSPRPNDDQPPTTTLIITDTTTTELTLSPTSKSNLTVTEAATTQSINPTQITAITNSSLPPTSGGKKLKNMKMSVFSKHLKTIKQSDEQKQRNSFNQFWFEGSTHQDRQDKLPSDDKERLQINSLGSYVSNLVIKGLLASADPIQPPHIENYSSSVLFADISGFTSLTERLGGHGQEGVELLTRNLNRYFEIMIKVVKGYGGDIVKFAGDAVLTHWPTHGDVTNRVRIACECALSLQRKLHNFPVPGGFLTLHIGIGCGNISGLYVGGAMSKVEFLIAGEGLIQATLCEKEAESGEIYISPQCQEVIKNFANCTKPKGKTNYKLDSMVLLDKKEKKPTADNSEQMLVSMDRKFLFDLPLLMDMEASLQRFVPSAVINQLKHGHGEYLAELRYISVIFVNLSYGVPDPVKDLKKLQSIVVEIQKIVYKYEGTVRQFMIDDKGCVLIACWGVPPFSHEDDPSRAVEAAMEIVVALFKLTVISTVGVTTGKCFCGDVGSDERREYAVVGDIVNLSARLMSHSQGGVLCDEETSKNAKNIEFVRLSDPIKVKGKAAPIPVFKPIKKYTLEHQSPRNHPVRNRALIGRQLQLKQVSDLIEKIRDGLGTQVVLIEAEAGLGKSRFISEIKYSFCQGLKVVKAMGVQMNESVPFYIWKQLLAEPLKELEAQEYRSLLQLGPHVGLLNPILDIKVNAPEVNRRYSAPQRAETQQMLMLRLVQMLIPRDTVIVIDDAHHMDSASWTLALNLCHQLENHLIMIALRPMKEGIPHGFTQLNDIETIQLEPLATKEETAQLINQMLNSDSCPDEIVEEIFNRSQGNHFVIEEMLNGLRAANLFDESTQRFNSKLEAIEHIRVSLPRTVTSLITSRIDRLTNAQQLELKVASVIGTPFTIDSLYRILPTELTTREALLNDLAILEKLHFIRSRVGSTGGDLVYSFQHTRTQEVVYDLMLFAQRRELHHKIASIMELTNTPQHSLFVALVHHYHQAQDNTKTIEYASKAGGIALSDNNNKEAVRFFQMALKCLEELNNNQSENHPALEPEEKEKEKKPNPKKVHRRSASSTTNFTSQQEEKGKTSKKSFEVVSISRKLGLALYNMGALQSASLHFLTALKHLGIEMPPNQGAAPPAPTGARKLVRLGPKVARQDSLTKFFTSTLDPFEKREAILCLVLLSKIFLHDCSKQSSSWCAFVASQLATESWNLQSEAFSIGIRVLGSNGNHTTPLKYYAEILARSDETNGYVYGNSHQSWGIYMAGLGRWTEAESGFQKSSESAGKMGDKKMMEESSVFLAMCLYFMGQWRSSINLSQKSLESSRVRGDIQLQIMALITASFSHYRLGELTTCGSIINDVESLFNSIGAAEVSLSFQVNFYILKSLLALQMNDPSTAYEYCKRTYAQLVRGEPNNFTTFEAYASIPLVLIKLMQNSPTGANRSKMLTEINDSITLLEKFTDMFAIGQPRTILLKTVVSILSGKDPSSDHEDQIKEAKEKATKLLMPFEEELCVYYQSLYFSSDDSGFAAVIAPSSPTPSVSSPSISKVSSPEKKSDVFNSLFGLRKEK